MPKTKISEYSTTNSDNTDIESINIAEGCAPSGINNAIRELMVHLKEFQTGASGDAFTFAGGVLISGTANTITGNVLMSGTNTITGSTTATFAAGAVGTPSIAAHGDTNTGIFFPAADTIAFAEGGAEAMRIDSDGDVGIGTTSPSRRLTTQFDSATTYSSSDFDATSNQLFLRNANTTTNAFTGIYFGVGTNGEAAISSIRTGDGEAALAFGTRGGGSRLERMRIDSSGNVGIGTTSPNAKLEIKDGQTRFYHANSGNNAGYGIEFSTDGGGTDTTIASIFPGQDGASVRKGYLGFATSNAGAPTERARITSGGYFKASNDGSYLGPTGTYHEFGQTANTTGVAINTTNASYSSLDGGVAIYATRSATSAYALLTAWSGAGGDKEFSLYGDGNGKCDGAWTGGGADYAEFFESVNGQALTLGATVVLDGNKVREATDQDPTSAIFGVVRPKEPSKASAMIGNAAWNKWAKKYLTDDFDRYIMEDHDVVEWEETITDEEGKTSTKQHSYESHNIPAGVTVPADAVRKTHDDKGNKFQHYKLNPAWDKDAEYVNRENRPEWNIIGLLGQVKILKGQPVGDRWIKMRDVSATVEEWMIR